MRLVKFDVGTNRRDHGQLRSARDSGDGRRQKERLPSPLRTRQSAQAGHFLTGQPVAIMRSPRLSAFSISTTQEHQYAHATAIMVLTPQAASRAIFMELISAQRLRWDW